MLLSLPNNTLPYNNRWSFYVGIFASQYHSDANTEHLPAIQFKGPLFMPQIKMTHRHLYFLTSLKRSCMSAKTDKLLHMHCRKYICWLHHGMFQEFECTGMHEAAGSDRLNPVYHGASLIITQQWTSWPTSGTTIYLLSGYVLH